MKKLGVVILSLILLASVFSSCSSDSGTKSSNAELYKNAIERYLKAYIKADLDTLLDSLDADGPLYPSPDTIENLRNTANGSAVEGEVIVKELTVLEESSAKAKVKATVYMHLDMSGNGDWQEDTRDVIFDLTLKNGTWRLYDATEET
jgi:hypothetical protein